MLVCYNLITLYACITLVPKCCCFQELDEAALAEFRSKLVEDGKAEYTEQVVARNIVEGVLAIVRGGDQDLIIVGRGRFSSSMVVELPDRQAEHSELGPVGDILASSGHGVVSSVLVIQQHDVAHARGSFGVQDSAW